MVKLGILEERSNIYLAMVESFTTCSFGALYVSRIQRTRCCAHFISTGVGGCVAGLARTSFRVIFDGEYAEYS